MLPLNAIGVASSMGGLVQTAAAFRAGLSRPIPAPDLHIMFPGDHEAEPISSCIVPSAAAFQGVGRLVALLAAAFADLALRADSRSFRPDVGLFLALPDPAARGFTLA